MPGFRPNDHYIREMQRIGVLADEVSATNSIDIYTVDRVYWKSFWYRP